jgi:hypothetical protein
MGVNTAKPAVANNTPAAQPVVPGAPVIAGPLLAEPFWPLGTPLSMLLYTSTTPDSRDTKFNEPLVVWDGLTYGDFADVRDANIVVDIPESVRSHNGSMWLDVVLLKDGGRNPLDKPRSDVAISRKRAYISDIQQERPLRYDDRIDPIPPSKEGTEREEVDQRCRRREG